MAGSTKPKPPARKRRPPRRKQAYLFAQRQLLIGYLPEEVREQLRDEYALTPSSTRSLVNCAMQRLRKLGDADVQRDRAENLAVMQRRLKAMISEAWDLGDRKTAATLTNLLADIQGLKSSKIVNQVNLGFGGASPGGNPALSDLSDEQLRDLDQQRRIEHKPVIDVSAVIPRLDAAAQEAARSEQLLTISKEDSARLVEASKEQTDADG